ncbi:MAG: SLOG family protein [Prevotella sp.]
MTKLKYDKVVSVCFSGHRNVPFAGRSDLKQRLKSEIANAYADGFRCFYCGMAMGFDLLAAEAALSLQSELKDLQVIAVVPFRGQSDRWSKEAQAKYDAILRIVDDVVVLSERYFNGCLLKRNDYMVNHSSRLIAYYDGLNKGGTFYTVKKAGQNGLEVVNLHNSV